MQWSNSVDGLVQCSNSVDGLSKWYNSVDWLPKWSDSLDGLAKLSISVDNNEVDGVIDVEGVTDVKGVTDVEVDIVFDNGDVSGVSIDLSDKMYEANDDKLLIWFNWKLDSPSILFNSFETSWSFNSIKCVCIPTWSNKFLKNKSSKSFVRASDSFNGFDGWSFIIGVDDELNESKSSFLKAYVHINEA